MLDFITFEQTSYQSLPFCPTLLDIQVAQQVPSTDRFRGIPSSKERINPKVIQKVKTQDTPRLESPLFNEVGLSPDNTKPINTYTRPLLSSKRTGRPSQYPIHPRGDCDNLSSDAEIDEVDESMVSIFEEFDNYSEFDDISIPMTQVSDKTNPKSNHTDYTNKFTVKVSSSKCYTDSIDHSIEEYSMKASRIDTIENPDDFLLKNEEFMRYMTQREVFRSSKDRKTLERLY